MSTGAELISGLIRAGCITPTALSQTKVGEVFNIENGIAGGLVVAKVMLYQAAYTLLLDEKLTRPSIKHGLLVVAREFPAIKLGSSVMRENPPISTVTIFTNQRPSDLWIGLKDTRPLLATLDVAAPIVLI